MFLCKNKLILVNVLHNSYEVFAFYTWALVLFLLPNVHGT